MVFLHVDMNSLDQNKLNVSNKERSNIFDWRGQFTPEFVEYLLASFSKPGMLIADPFLGSGTVIIESIKRHLSCVGYELNPSAFYMSKFYEYSKNSKECRDDIINQAHNIIETNISKLSKDIPLFVKADTYRESYASLLSFAHNIKNIDNALVPFLINVLFLCEKDKKMTLKEALYKNFNIMSTNLLSLPYSDETVEVNLGDSRNIGEKYCNKVDLIITSPPYINVFNYHQNYRGIIECFGYNVLNVANSEFGSNRKNRTNRFRPVVQYTMDMGNAILSATKSLKVNGRMILIVGRESNVRNTPFYNSVIIENIIEIIHCLSLEGKQARHFKNRFGETITEDILIIKKEDNQCDCPDDIVFKEVGLKHISKALDYSQPSVHQELLDVLNHPDIIKSSPIL